MSATTMETYVCGYCGAEQSREVTPWTCPQCGHFGPTRDFPSHEILRIRQQNDSFRQGIVIGGCPFPGTVVITAGVQDRGEAFVTGACLAVAFDEDFHQGNDPVGDHSFGFVTVRGERLYWKIDYYDAAREYGSDDPSDPARTHRVLTILFPSEY
ncbi:DUF3768 domain-containing protein [Paracoccus sp. YIM 132242]|uniref:DUF3768 domain-containing protein n=1 Tax=Paracoccus lichenicola TaxID=2665644 RepID=A0A6L6HR80_9RHOB|nr:DUF3768 domain-containing protein [Paracoccus lichenicola]MTE01674.1 DUF3768 domain-containing protein [Paracoccus lichenicola]